MKREPTFSQRQLYLLRQLVLATDEKTPLHRSGDAHGPGLVSRGATINSLVKRGLAKLEGYGMEVDGDGFAVTGNDDAPVYVVTDAGRAALAKENAKPALNYKVICISMYVDDLYALDRMVEKLKGRGIQKASRSGIIRAALAQLDLEKVDRDAIERESVTAEAS